MSFTTAATPPTLQEYLPFLIHHVQDLQALIPKLYPAPGAPILHSLSSIILHSRCILKGVSPFPPTAPKAAVPAPAPHATSSRIRFAVPTITTSRWTPAPVPGPLTPALFLSTFARIIASTKIVNQYFHTGLDIEHNAIMALHQYCNTDANCHCDLWWFFDPGGYGAVKINCDADRRWKCAPEELGRKMRGAVRVVEEYRVMLARKEEIERVLGLGTWDLRTYSVPVAKEARESGEHVTGGKDWSWKEVDVFEDSDDEENDVGNDSENDACDDIEAITALVSACNRPWKGKSKQDDGYKMITLTNAPLSRPLPTPPPTSTTTIITITMITTIIATTMIATIIATIVATILDCLFPTQWLASL